MWAPLVCLLVSGVAGNVISDFEEAIVDIVHGEVVEAGQLLSSVQRHLAEALAALGDQVDDLHQNPTWHLHFNEPHSGLEIKAVFNDSSDWTKGCMAHLVLPGSPGHHLDLWISGPLHSLTVSYLVKEAPSMEERRRGSFTLNLSIPDRTAAVEFVGITTVGTTTHQDTLSGHITLSPSPSSPSPSITLTSTLGGINFTINSTTVDWATQTATIRGWYQGSPFHLTGTLKTGEETEVLVSGDLLGPVKARLTLQTRAGALHKVTVRVVYPGTVPYLDLYWLADPFYFKLTAPSLIPGTVQTLSTRGRNSNRIRDWQNTGVWFVPSGGVEEVARPVIGDYRKDGRTVSFTLHNTDGMEYFLSLQWGEDALLANSAAMLLRGSTTTKLGLVWDLTSIDKAQVYAKLSEDDQGKRREVTHEAKASLAKGRLRSRIFYVEGNGDGTPLPENKEEAEEQGLQYAKVLTSGERKRSGAVTCKVDVDYSRTALTASGSLRFRPRPQPSARVLLAGQAGATPWKLIEEGQVLGLTTAQKFLDSVMDSLAHHHGLALIRGELF